jgi:propanol-preferring alcohol dehydrogenase
MLKALQYLEIGLAPKIVEVPEPAPAAGQVRLKVLAAGACHSDVFIMGLPESLYTFGLPLTLGHEAVGVVDEVGDGVDAALLGEVAAVYGAWGCGRCYRCASGAENYCERASSLGIAPPGLGAPGAMAEYLIVDSPRHLVSLNGLDPVGAVSLTDAGLTPYHAIKGSLSVLVPGSVAVIIGAGGLGHVAIQMLRALTNVTVVALDVDTNKLAHAAAVGAHHTFTSNTDAVAAVAAVRELSGGLGASAVFDFVVNQATMDLGKPMMQAGGHQVLVGVGMGTMGVGLLAGPYEWQVRSPYWGSLSELHEALALARSGAVKVTTETFSLDDAPLAYEKLHNGTLTGRAVVVP